MQIQNLPLEDLKNLCHEAWIHHRDINQVINARDDHFFLATLAFPAISGCLTTIAIATALKPFFSLIENRETFIADAQRANFVDLREDSLFCYIGSTILFNWDSFRRSLPLDAPPITQQQAEGFIHKQLSILQQRLLKYQTSLSQSLVLPSPVVATAKPLFHLNHPISRLFEALYTAHQNRLEKHDPIEAKVFETAIKELQAEIQGLSLENLKALCYEAWSHYRDICQFTHSKQQGRLPAESLAFTAIRDSLVTIVRATGVKAFLSVAEDQDTFMPEAEAAAFINQLGNSLFCVIRSHIIDKWSEFCSTLPTDSLTQEQAEGFINDCLPQLEERLFNNLSDPLSADYQPDNSLLLGYCYKGRSLIKSLLESDD